VRALLHLANGLFLLSYLVRDIVWLRLVTFAAGALLVAHFALQPTPPVEPLAWNVLFLSLNGVQLARLIHARRPLRLTGDEAHLHQMVFRSLAPRDFRRVMALAAWRAAVPGDELVAAGQPLERLLVLFDGRVAIEVKGQRVADLCGGRLLGEMSFLTGEAPSARVVALTACRYVAWPSSSLRRLVATDPSLEAALQAVIGADLAAKLRGA
jgi:hypothetical protein